MQIGYATYKEYLAIKQHFSNDKYDYFLYNGQVKTSEQTFLKRKDKILFSSFEMKHEEINKPYFFAAQFIYSDNVVPFIFLKPMNIKNSLNLYNFFVDKLKNLDYIKYTDNIIDDFIKQEIDVVDIGFLILKNKIDKKNYVTKTIMKKCNKIIPFIESFKI